MTYKESLDWLFAQLPMFSRVGAAAYKPGLERSEALSEYFGNPHKRWRSIHIAGTNGKGSVSHLIASTLQAAGYKVGLYTSPHLEDFRERMRINGEMIPQQKVVDFIERWQCGEYPGDRPSFFELTMMMAFEWFAAEGVDFAVIEVGMGGRLDSTNIITPLLSVITNISFDHTQFLGDTLPKIAKEKAGIIKPGVPVVIGEADGEVEAVFRRHASEKGSTIREAYREYDKDKNDALGSPLKGWYQQHNINTARVAIGVLREIGIAIPEEAQLLGFREVERLTGLRGRWSVIQQNPMVICDAGHNEAGLRQNMQQLRALMQERPKGELRFVIGFVADKDVEHILDLFPKDAIYYTTNAAIPRAMPQDQLTALCRAKGFNARGYKSVREAIDAALTKASVDDVIYIGGSFFIVAEAV